tara:strand:+ start:7981 stop:8295 length:315 start_codon:yes stop_codon:yes gene_type:complete
MTPYTFKLVRKDVKDSWRRRDRKFYAQKLDEMRETHGEQFINDTVDGIRSHEKKRKRDGSLVWENFDDEEILTREQALDALAAQGQELEMGYENGKDDNQMEVG